VCVCDTVCVCVCSVSVCPVVCAVWLGPESQGYEGQGYDGQGYGGQGYEGHAGYEYVRKDTSQYTWICGSTLFCLRSQQGQEPYAEDDEANLDEIDQALGYGDEEEDALDDIEAELEAQANAYGVRAGGGGGGVLPAGAVPSQGGKLSAHAAEFWFPECRNCPCCSGYKHGCKCRDTGVDTCTDANCVNADYVNQVNTALQASASTSSSSVRHAISFI
jgi:hypothetical protein